MRFHKMHECLEDSRYVDDAAKILYRVIVDSDQCREVPVTRATGRRLETIRSNCRD